MANSEASPHSLEPMKMDKEQSSCLKLLEEEFMEIKVQNATIMSQQNNIIELLKSRIPNYLTPIPKPDMKLWPAIPNDFERDETLFTHAISTSSLSPTNSRIVMTRPSIGPSPIWNWDMELSSTDRSYEMKQNWRPHLGSLSWSFVAEFCLKNETQLALVKLETTWYYQGKCTVNKYVNDFQELIGQAGYMEGLGIITKFHCWLNKEIQDQIVNIQVGWPKEASSDKWYQAVIRSDENRIGNELFHSTPKTTVRVKPPLSFLLVPPSIVPATLVYYSTAIAPNMQCTWRQQMKSTLSQQLLQL
jgi:hypothetical protein